MSKRFRLLLLLVLLGIAFYFLYPSIQWYFLLSPQVKELALSSRPQIKTYAERKAREVLAELQALPLGEPLPAQYQFLTRPAAEKYKAEGRAAPKSWTLEEVFRGFPGKADLLVALESRYRDEILAAKELRERTMQLGLDLRGGMRVLIRAKTEELAKEGSLSAAEKNDAVRRALEVLTNRIDQFGVTEPQIRRQGDDMILVELPGEVDRESMNKFIQGRGVLNFHIVDDEGLAAFRQYQAENPGDLIDAEGNLSQPPVLPAGTTLRGYYQKDSYGMDQLRGYTVLKEQAGVSGNYIRDARVTADPVTGKPNVVFILTGEGGETFYKLTSDNVDKTLAVVLGDKVKAQARIAEPIPGGQVRVTGFDRQEADDLALVLRTGALPVPLEVVESQAVGATLGADAIRIGLRAAVIGFGAVMLFMLLYYLGGGITAVLALLLNAFFMFSILSVFNFTLTLPAITGMVLTIGMAVDANVLIFERMKEESRLGKSSKAVVKTGFAKAFWAIADSNITTFIAAIVLSMLGKGPIKGFAVSLAVGVVSSMFTALFVSRLCYDFGTDVLKIRRLSLGWRRLAA